MITSFIFETMPMLFSKLGKVIKKSGLYRALAALYHLIYRLVHQSLICSIFTKHKDEGKMYRTSGICAFLDKMLAFFPRVLGKVISALTGGTNTSVLFSCWGKLLKIYPFLDFELVVGVSLAFIFVCPGFAWSNAVGLLISLFLAAVLFVLTALGKRKVLTSKEIGLPFVIFVIATVFSVGAAKDIPEAIRVFTFFVTAFLLCVVMIGTLTNEKKLKKVLGFIYISLVITAIYGFIQRINGVSANASFTDLTVNANMPGRIFSTFDNPNNYAEFIVLMFPMAFAFCTMIKNQSAKLLAYFGMILPVGALLMTYSRSGWISFALMVIVFIFLTKKQLLPVFIILGIMCIPVLPESIYNRILTIGSLKDSSNMYRVHIWGAALNVIEDHWLTGVGLGPANFRPEYLLYSTNRAMAAIHSHMQYLEVWIEMGLLGIISYLTYYITTIRKAVINISSASKGARIALIGGVSALVGIAFISAAEYIWFYPRVMLTFFILAGITTACVNMTKKKD